MSIPYGFIKGSLLFLSNKSLSIFVIMLGVYIPYTILIFDNGTFPLWLGKVSISLFFISLSARLIVTWVSKSFSIIWILDIPVLAGLILSEDDPLTIFSLIVMREILLLSAKALTRSQYSLTKSVHPIRILVAGFIVAIVAGSVLLSLPLSQSSMTIETNFLNSIFTAISATTVTGLIIEPVAQHYSSFGHIVIVILMQIGGLGITTFTTMSIYIIGNKMLIKEKIAINSIYSHEAKDDIKKITFDIIAYTIICTTIGSFILIIIRMLSSHSESIGETIVWGIFHSVSAFNNAGFSLEHDSLATLTEKSPGSTVVIHVLSLLGSLSFMLAFAVIRWIKNTTRNQSHFSFSVRIIILVNAILIFTAMPLFLASEWSNSLADMNLGEKILTAFYYVSGSRTSGFNYHDYSSMSAQGNFLMMGLMVIGGAPGSAAGGIKVTTAFVLFIGLWINLQRKAFYLWNRRISHDLIKKSVLVFTAIIGLIFLGTCALALGQDPKIKALSLAFEAVSAVCTTGLSTGITGNLRSIDHVILGVLMFLGRIGPVSLALLTFSRSRMEQ